MVKIYIRKKYDNIYLRFTGSLLDVFLLLHTVNDITLWLTHSLLCLFCHYFCRLPPIFLREELFEWPINSHVFSNTKEPKSFKSYELVRKLKKDQL